MAEKLKIGVLYSFLPLNVHHGEHKDVDVGAAELPAGPVYGQTKRWILRKHDDDFAGESKTVDKRLKHTVLALHRATINSDMSLMCAKLTFSFKKVLNVSDNSLFLLP